MQWFEQICGALLVLLILLDVFLTVLYARANAGIISPRVARLVWWVFKAIAKPFGRVRDSIFSFCGPAILVMLVVVWALGLTVAAGLIIHPELGTSVRATSGDTPGDFITAIYAGGSSISVIGATDFTPHTASFRLLFLFNSLVGVSVTFLTLTYLMQVYTALDRRNTLGLNVHLASAETGDAAELIAHLGPEGKFEAGYMNLSLLAAEMTKAKESHHFYPVLFYFRFRQPFYSVSRFTLVSLDTATLIKSALSDRDYAWLKNSGAVEQLWDGAMLLLETVSEMFLHGAKRGLPHAPDEDTCELWRGRYFAALRTLRQAGIQTVYDEQAGADYYVNLRRQWNDYIMHMAPLLAYSKEDIDPVGYRAETSHEERRFQPHASHGLPFQPHS
jgi:hypothetical protein